jgi:hypothetical protein
MKRPVKPPPNEDTSRPSFPSPEQEVLQIVHDYAEALREILKKLRQKFN